MKTIVANQLSGGKKENHPGFSDLTVSLKEGGCYGFVGDKENGLEDFIMIISSHNKTSKGRVLYDGYEYNQKGGEVTLPLDIYSDQKVHTVLTFIDRLFLGPKFMLYRSEFLCKTFSDFKPSDLKKPAKKGASNSALHNLLHYLSFSHKAFFMELDMVAFDESQKKNICKILLAYAERFLEILIITVIDEEDSKSMCHQVFSLNTSESIYERPKEKDEYDIGDDNKSKEKEIVKM